MPNAPSFFVPAATPENTETVYAELARFAGRPVPSVGQRIYSISYTHHGEHWTSTVGESSRGFKRVSKGRGSSRREFESRLDDPGIILAIFPGDPFTVVTDDGIGGRRTGTKWANPFLMGRDSIHAIVKFAAAG